MKKNIQDLAKKYPKIFKHYGGNPMETCMAFGIECGSGWYDLIDSLCQQLQNNTDHNHYPQVVADQVKEKYGTLRFYYHCEPGPIDIHKVRYTKWYVKVFETLVNVYNKSLKIYNELSYKLRFRISKKRWIKILPIIDYWGLSVPNRREENHDGCIEGAISFAEYMSGAICENCGNPGICNDNGWISCSCDECRK